MTRITFLVIWSNIFNLDSGELIDIFLGATISIKIFCYYDYRNRSHGILRNLPPYPEQDYIELIQFSIRIIASV